MDGKEDDSMNRKKWLLLAGALVLLLCAAAAWHAWLTRPITVMTPSLEAENVSDILVGDHLGWMGCMVDDPEAIQRAVDLLNQLTVRRSGTYQNTEECSGYVITVYMSRGSSYADTSLGGGWNYFYLNGPELFYDGVRYKVLDGLGDALLLQLLQSGETKTA